MTAVDQKTVDAAKATIRVVAETIKELGEVPSGHLYANMMAVGMSLHGYETIIGLLKEAGLITVQNNLITWVGA